MVGVGCYERVRALAAEFAFAGLQLRADGFDFGVGLECFVPHFAAPAGLLVATERQGGTSKML
jgi:hypothetical protein